jgi:hypothetical protein
VDDNFIGNRRNVRKLLPALAEWQAKNGRPSEFLTEASVNLADDDALLEGMRRANFRRVFLGIETPVAEHRGKFAMSMRLAAMGYHFRKLVEAHDEWLTGFAAAVPSPCHVPQADRCAADKNAGTPTGYTSTYKQVQTGTYNRSYYRI